MSTVSTLILTFIALMLIAFVAWGWITTDQYGVPFDNVRATASTLSKEA